VARQTRSSRRATQADRLAEAQRTKVAGLPEWRWRTFPVFFAFFVGALVMAAINGAPDNAIAAVAQFVVLAALSYGLARIFVRKVFAERRLTRREKQIARGEISAGGDEYEDVVVYPDRAKKS
jgi:hypothetical protein